MLSPLAPSSLTVDVTNSERLSTPILSITYPCEGSSRPIHAEQRIPELNGRHMKLNIRMVAVQQGVADVDIGGEA